MAATPTLTNLSTEDEVCAWLGSLPAEMACYFGSVRRNKVDGRAMFHTPLESLLAKLEIESVGHKVILKKHITLLREATPGAVLEDAGPVNARNVLMSPPETSGWMTLKEGYLYKTKRVRKGFHKSTKLRWFVLKQEPMSRAVRLEYYEGMAFRGGAALEKASVLPGQEGAFFLLTKERKLDLSAEKGNLKAATSWVLAIQGAIHAYERERRERMEAAARSVPKSGSISSVSSAAGASPDAAAATVPEDLAPTPAPDAAEAESAPARRGKAGEVDGNAIDQARWAAIRKATAAADAATEEAMAEDPDVLMLRQMEEEEERRQEEERLAFLAERAAKQAATSTPAPESADAVSEARTGEISEEEDEEEILRQMREAEEEEERRQEAERQEWLAQQAAKAAAAP